MPATKDAGTRRRSTNSANAEQGHCIACGASDWAPKYRVLVECNTCGFIRAQLNVTPQEIEALYREDYFRGQEYADYLGDIPAHEKNCAIRMSEITRVAGRPNSVFEVGCAYGLWLKHLTDIGVPCAGIDVCADTVRYAVEKLKQQAVAGDFLSLSVPQGKYDAFCLWDTIEHLAHPELFVHRIHSLLPPQGWLFLTTGDIGSKLARSRGPRWRMIHPPTHLQYFSTDSMTQMLQRTGFEVVDVHSAPVYRTLGGTLANLAVLGKGASRHAARALAACLPGFLQRRVGLTFDLGDIMFVAARKPA